MWKLSDRNVDEVTRGDDAIINMVPQLEPKHSPRQRIGNLVKVQLKLFQGLRAESYLGISRISIVDLVGLDGLSNVDFDFVELLSITEDDVVDVMLDKFVIL